MRCWKIEKEKRDKRLVHSQLSLHLTSMGVYDILVFKFEIYFAPACIQHTYVKSSPSDGANQTHLPSKAPKQNDPTTGGEETLRCRSGDPCSSPANHPPYNSPKRHDRGWWRLMSGHLHFHVKKCGLKKTTGYLSSIVNDGEVGLPAWLLRSEKFGMVALLCRQLLHK